MFYRHASQKRVIIVQTKLGKEGPCPRRYVGDLASTSRAAAPAKRRQSRGGKRCGGHRDRSADKAADDGDGDLPRVQESARERCRSAAADGRGETRFGLEMGATTPLSPPKCRSRCAQKPGRMAGRFREGRRSRPGDRRDLSSGVKSAGRTAEGDRSAVLPRVRA